MLRKGLAGQADCSVLRSKKRQQLGPATQAKPDDQSPLERCDEQVGGAGVMSRWEERV